ncbi:hypothetical protein ALMP_57280 [Streptomyces sp. A012304]|nr:hypothetical protein [Streptomyces sp. A012304]GKQ39199.1 hypothetical protein ALMP_57280 [Streptomyces sp. A012304]
MYLDTGAEFAAQDGGRERVPEVLVGSAEHVLADALCVLVAPGSFDDGGHDGCGGRLVEPVGLPLELGRQLVADRAVVEGEKRADAVSECVDEEGLLVGPVPVDGGAADSGTSGDSGVGDVFGAAFGKEFGGGGQGGGAAAQGAGVVVGPGHRAPLP